MASRPRQLCRLPSTILLGDNPQTASVSILAISSAAGEVGGKPTDNEGLRAIIVAVSELLYYSYWMLSIAVTGLPIGTRPSCAYPERSSPGASASGEKMQRCPPH
ncbi:hypothetical protein K445DRAFT_313236, partial [Daldinia sp. EC12]